jgi:hypothetical protein
LREYGRAKTKGRKGVKDEGTKEIFPHQIKTGISTRIYENYLRFPSLFEAQRARSASIFLYVELIFGYVTLDKASLTTKR